MTRAFSRHATSSSIYKSLARRTKRLASLRRNERGGVMAYVALCLPVLVGFGGLAVDVTSWYAKHRVGQVMVDSAVLAGSAELARMGGNVTIAQIRAAANESAGLNGYEGSDAGQVLTINWPPAAGPFQGNANFVEGVMSAPGANFFSRIFTSDGLTIRNRAVGTLAPPNGNACIYGLSETAREAVRITGNSTVNIDCAIHSNTEFEQGGNSCVAASDVYHATTVSTSCLKEYDSGIADPNNNNNDLAPTQAGVIADPMAAFLLQNGPGSDLLADIETLYHEAGCDFSGNQIFNASSDVNNPQPVPAGKYCGNVSILGAVVFESGFLQVEGGAFSFSSQSNSQVATFTAPLTPDMNTVGAPISFLIDSGHKNDTLTINGGAVIDFTAHNLAQIDAINANQGLAGVLFMQTGDYGSRLTINGGSTVTLDGMVYAPDAEVQYNGTSNLSHSNLTIIADTVDINGNSTFVTGALGSGGGNPAFNTGSKLVE